MPPGLSRLALEGSAVRLRPFAEADLPTLLAILSEPEVGRWWGPYDEPKLRGELSDPKVTAWVILADDTDTPSGLVVAREEPDPDYRHAELDIFLTPLHHGRGLGADALRTALHHLFEEQGHHRAVIVPAADNERAIRSYARVGFKPIGVMRRSERAPDGRWHDELAMDLLAHEWGP